MSDIEEDDAEDVDTEEGLRRLGWELVILRDQVLKIAEQLPAAERERILRTSERMTASVDRLRNALNWETAGSYAEALKRLHDEIVVVQRELALVAKELFAIADGRFWSESRGEENRPSEEMN